MKHLDDPSLSNRLLTAAVAFVSSFLAGICLEFAFGMVTSFPSLLFWIFVAAFTIHGFLFPGKSREALTRMYEWVLEFFKVR